MSASTNFSSRAVSLEVIDPCNRTGKIVVPLEYVTETRGITEQNRPRESRDLSLCLLFQKGRCNAGPRCHQVHVEPSFVNKLRAQAAAGTACCALHGDFQSSSYLSHAPKTVEVYTNGTPALYPLIAFGRTAALDNLLSNSSLSTIRVNAAKVCRLHSEGRCKFGRDCKNIHLCPTAKPASSPVKPAPLEGFSRPTGFSASGKCNVDPLELSSQRLDASATATLAHGPICPDTPEAKSHRSTSASSVTPTVPSSNASSTSVSPKEKGLMNRTLAAPLPLFSDLSGNASSSTAGSQSSQPQPIGRFSVPASPKGIDYCNPFTGSWMLYDSLLSVPSLSTTAASPNTFKGSDEFQQTASLLVEDFAKMTISPSWNVAA